MRFILKVPGKFVLAFHVVTMAVVPTSLSIGWSRSPPSSAARSSLHWSLMVPPTGGEPIRGWPREEHPSHQALSDEAWLQGWFPAPPYRAISRASIFVVPMKAS
ncbi:hypothetical protein AMECASPLE_025052 [Ameca splendens]|uniref:Secreted protein n=1 Tax=Ameca splendens TaxID=208324 RepID=A0ABV1A283_9TELE